MAQAVFEEHPLEQYLRDVGEARDLLPGGTAEFMLPHDEYDTEEFHDDAVHVEWLPEFVHLIFDRFRSAVHSAHRPSSSDSFAERFKYDVISSSLLSSSIAATPHSRRPSSPAFPGRLSIPAPPHATTHDTLTGKPRSQSDKFENHFQSSLESAGDLPYWPNAFGLGVIVAFFSAGYYFLSFITLGCNVFHLFSFSSDSHSKSDTAPSLDSLRDLIAASDVWESVVHDAVTILENDEQRIFYGPTTPSSPTSPVRVALHSSLHTTQTQCDNVRQLLSALTSPSELSQLSEMYAPPSPPPMKTTLLADHIYSPRPLSHPGSRERTTSVPSPSDAKRATWNGSYATLALAGSPTKQSLRRREQRKTELSSLLEATSPMRPSKSAPVSPAMNNPGLSDVAEELPPLETEDNFLGNDDEEPHIFGIAALDLQRKRKRGGLEVLKVTFPHSPMTTPTKNYHLTPTTSSASRFTTMHTARHPLSLSAIQLAMQGAVASKRYACSHLLALRFNDDDDDAYWEDVRSVMGLLTTTFVDASARLTEALDEADQKRLKDENPSSDSSPPTAKSGTFTLTFDTGRSSQKRAQTTNLLQQQMSFAPMPSHLTRFAAHVDTISCALTNAREQLDLCVAALRDDSLPQGGDHHRPISPTEQPEQHPEDDNRNLYQQYTPALQAYDQLRLKLGLALRECERGRERLLDVLAPPHAADGSEGDADDLPALGHDNGSSDESDKPDSTSLSLDQVLEDSVRVHGVDGMVAFADGVGIDEEDDGMRHLLIAQHLPPQGAEQVFEAESGGEGGFTREKSKLSREERIELMKARRESGLGVNPTPDSRPKRGGVELWGPGEEVVQELKDVIWQVGERRRKLAES